MDGDNSTAERADAGAPRTRLLLAGAIGAAIVVAVVVYVVTRSGGGYEGVADLRAAMEDNGYPCEVVAGTPARVLQRGSEATICEITSGAPARYRLGLRVFLSEDAYTRFEGNVRSGDLVHILGGNWLISTGQENPLPEDERFFNRMAEDLGGEVVGGS